MRGRFFDNFYQSKLDHRRIHKRRFLGECKLERDENFKVSSFLGKCMDHKCLIKLRSFQQYLWLFGLFQVVLSPQLQTHIQMFSNKNLINNDFPHSIS
jgi:hypothetical protein